MTNRIAELRKSAGLTMQDLAERVGTTAPQINKLEKGERRLTVDWMRRIAAALGVDAGALIAEGIVTAARLGTLPGGTGTIRPKGDRNTVTIDGESYARIGVFDARAAAGAGSIGSDERVARLLFRLDWLRSVTEAPIDALGVIEVEGDSMEPTLRPGDHILVDMVPGRSLQADGIYVLRREQFLQVKRLTAHPVTGRLTVSSDNPAYARYVDLDPKDVDVVGRVIWLGRRV